MSDGFPSTTAPTVRRRHAASRFSRNTVRAIRQAVAIATELDLHSVAIAGGGVLPNIHATLLPKKSQSKK